ncbi:cysteine-rich CWC family protein [Poriferisphaera corsica]|uniref:cysteine-rich CWC family protein n=1 Tax=Poriferisphaera corsica TaxID=2528020 RepID=UPI0011A2E2C5
MNAESDIEKICPLCSKPNNCYLHQTDAGECWCVSATIPQDLLDQIPDQYINKSCICKTCIDNYNNTKKRLK